MKVTDAIRRLYKMAELYCSLAYYVRYFLNNMWLMRMAQIWLQQVSWSIARPSCKAATPPANTRIGRCIPILSLYSLAASP